MRFPDDVPVLTDGTVTLRAPTFHDADRVVEQCTDRESITWTTVPHPYGHGEAEEWLGTLVPHGWERGDDKVLAIEYDGRFCGSVALRPQLGGEAEVAFGLHPAARGRGVMRRALDLLLDWAFADGVVVVHWRAFVGNWSSRRVAWASGFTFGPTVPRLLPHRGERLDAWTGWLHHDAPREPTAPWHELPVLETPRLRLRPWRDTDGAALVQAAHDPVLRRWVEAPLPGGNDEVAAYLTRIGLAAVTGDRFAWCIADRATDRALGNVSVFEAEGPAGDGAAQVGYWSHPAGRGTGLVSEAVDRVAAWMLSAEGGMRRLYLMTAAGNTAAQRVAERAGFTHVGTERDGARTADGFDDNLVYDRLR